MLKFFFYTLFIPFTLFSTALHSQNETELKAKETLKNIGFAYMAWNTSNTEYIAPDAYILEPTSEKIIGQNFLYPVGTQKFASVNLNYSNKEIASASMVINDVKSDIILGWRDGRMSSIKIQGLSEFDYDLNYDTKGLLKLTGKRLINGNIQMVKELEYMGDKIAKITSYENKINSKTPWIRSIKTFTYNQDEVILDCITYGTNKSNIPKNIVSTLKGAYKKNSDGTFTIVEPYGVIRTSSYDKNNLLINKKEVHNNGEVSLYSYVYINEKLFKEVEEKTRNNEFIEKTVKILFSKPNKDSNAPNYEGTQGSYKFDKNGECIFEAIDVKYRNKVNGVWGDWQPFKY